jgi:putative transposase
MKIKVYPSKECKDLLAQWFGTVRWTYNTALHAVKEKKVSWSLSDLRVFFVNKDSLENSSNSWALNVPYDVRDEAIRDLIKALRINKKKGEIFDMKFRSRKAPQESIVIHSKHWQAKRGPYFDLKQSLRSREKLPQDLVYDSRLIRTKLGEYYLCVLKPVGHGGESQAPMQTNDFRNITALDPGVRTFMTGYSPQGLVCEWGKGDATRLGRLCHCVSRLRSKAKKLNHKKRYRINKAILRIHKKIKNLVKDLHCKLAKWLCSNYDLILIPKFGTSQMVKKLSRKIRKSTAWKMLTWSHYAFKTRLMNKAKEYPGVQVVEVTEEYTSKTCTKCGRINQKLGGSKVFRCGCGMVLDRDFNGARNILLKYTRTII